MSGKMFKNYESKIIQLISSQLLILIFPGKIFKPLQPGGAFLYPL